MLDNVATMPRDRSRINFIRMLTITPIKINATAAKQTKFTNEAKTSVKLDFSLGESGWCIFVNCTKFTHVLKTGTVS